MKKGLLSAFGFVILFAGGSSFATIDPVWLFTDSHPPLLFNYFRYCDTARTGDFQCFALESDQLPDTGSSFDGSRYINFDYQFTSDSIFFRDEFDATIIKYRGRRPGYAGFKTAWDYGMTGFPISRYKYLVFAHKGPNQNHKVSVRCWYNDGDCGSPSFNEFIGSFTGSATWKLDTLVIPESVQNKPDNQRNNYPYFELVFIINNIDPNDTTSGPPGSLKIDEIRLAGCNPIDSSPKPQPKVAEGSPATFKVNTSRANAADMLTYQWLKDGVPIAGANDSIYTIAAVTPADAGMYSVAVTVSSSMLTFTSQIAPLNKQISVIKPRAVADLDSKDADEGGCGCGAGTILAFLPPLWFKTVSVRRRKKKDGRL